MNHHPNGATLSPLNGFMTEIRRLAFRRNVISPIFSVSALIMRKKSTMVTFCNFLRKKMRRRRKEKSRISPSRAENPNYFTSTEATRGVHKGFDVLILHKCLVKLEKKMLTHCDLPRSDHTHIVFSPCWPKTVFR